MPRYTIETTYLLPRFRKASYEAPSLEEACQMAVDDPDWSDGQTDDETGRPTRVTGIWPAGKIPYQDEAIPVPPGFGDDDDHQAPAAQDPRTA